MKQHDEKLNETNAKVGQLIKWYDPDKDSWVAGVIVREHIDRLHDMDGNVDWSLSVDKRDLPHKDWKAFRTIKVNGEEVDFSDGFTDLHTKSYKQILNGNGFKLRDTKPSLELVHKIRNYKT